MRALQPGDTLSRYRIVRRLGAGAMGEVYLAEDPQIERQLAIKTLLLAEDRGHDLEALTSRLLREAKTTGRLVHPHIVTLFDAGEDRGILYLAFEFVAGSDLLKRVASPPALTVAEVLRIVREAADGLDHAHQHGIVHRDVKPSNLLLDARGRVKVADFGIAKLAGASTELTMDGSVVGSPQYLSPEQVRGDELDGRSDVFSLGVVLWELLTRSRPFAGDTLTTIVYQILHKDPPPLVQLWPAVPPGLAALVARMLAKDREARFPNAAAVVQAVIALEQSLPPAFLASVPMASEDELGATRRLTATPTAADLTAATQIRPDPPRYEPALGAGNAGVGAALPLPALPPLPAPPVAPPRRNVGLLLGLVGGATMLAALTAVLMVWAPWKPGAGAVTAPPGQGSKDGAVPVDGRSSQAPVGQLASRSTKGATSPAAAPLVADSASNPDVGQTRVAERGSAADDAVSEPPTALAAAPPAAPPAATSGPVERAAAPPPVVVSPPPARTTPPAKVDRPAASTPPVRSGSTAAVPAPPVDSPAREPAVVTAPTPAAPEIQADRTLTTGLGLVFDVEPDDALVLVREVGERRATNIGKARDWDDREHDDLPARHYSLVGVGDYVVTIRKDGFPDYVLRVTASPSGPPKTKIEVALGRARRQAGSAKAGAANAMVEVEVREAVGFEIQPAAATAGAKVLVNGNERGAASQFRGAMGKWLELPAGSHTVEVHAAGYRAARLTVVVVASAAEKRQKVAVRLVPE